MVTSRDDILEHENVLDAEKAFEQIMKTSANAGGIRAIITPGRRDEFMIPGPRRVFTTPLTTPGSVTDTCHSKMPRTKPTITKPTIRIWLQLFQKTRKMVNCLKDCIFPKWRELFSIRVAQAGQNRSVALERFEIGMIS